MTPRTASLFGSERRAAAPETLAEYEALLASLTGREREGPRGRDRADAGLGQRGHEPVVHARRERGVAGHGRFAPPHGGDEAIRRVGIRHAPRRYEPLDG